MLYLVLALVALGFISAILGLLSHHKGGEEEPLQEGVSCNTCNGENTKCEQECMMEAATKDIVYYDDEELDRFKEEPPTITATKKWKNLQKFSIPCKPKMWQDGTEV